VYWDYKHSVKRDITLFLRLSGYWDYKHSAKRDITLFLRLSGYWDYKHSVKRDITLFSKFFPTMVFDKHSTVPPPLQRKSHLSPPPIFKATMTHRYQHFFQRHRKESVLVVHSWPQSEATDMSGWPWKVSKGTFDPDLTCKDTDTYTRIY